MCVRKNLARRPRADLARRVVLGGLARFPRPFRGVSARRVPHSRCAHSRSVASGARSPPSPRETPRDDLETTPWCRGCPRGDEASPVQCSVPQLAAPRWLTPTRSTYLSKLQPKLQRDSRSSNGRRRVECHGLHLHSPSNPHRRAVLYVGMASWVSSVAWPNQKSHSYWRLLARRDDVVRREHVRTLNDYAWAPRAYQPSHAGT